MKKYIIDQGQLLHLYEGAEGRAESHPEIAANYRKTIDGHRHFATEKEALEEAIRFKKEHTNSNVQIWAGYEKDEEYFRLTYWLTTDEWRIKQAADYVGLALMYDNDRIRIIINKGVRIEDVVAY